MEVRVSSTLKRFVIAFSVAMALSIAAPLLSFADDETASSQEQLEVAGGTIEANDVADLQEATQGEQAEPFESVSAQAEGSAAVPTLSGTAHVENIGDAAGAVSGDVLTLGTTGEAKRLEAIALSTSDKDVSLEYQSHVEGIGWENKWTSGVSGTTGQALRLEAIRIRVAGSAASSYDVFYRAHVQDIGWLNWAKNGEEAGSAGYALRMEALQIALVASGAAAPQASPASVTDEPYHCSLVSTSTHVQDIGWQDTVGEGEVSGTTGRALRLEGVTMRLQNQPCSGGDSL